MTKVNNRRWHALVSIISSKGMSSQQIAVCLGTSVSTFTKKKKKLIVNTALGIIVPIVKFSLGFNIWFKLTAQLIPKIKCLFKKKFSENALFLI